jgi:hypothetical protein
MRLSVVALLICVLPRSEGATTVPAAAAEGKDRSPLNR